MMVASPGSSVIIINNQLMLSNHMQQVRFSHLFKPMFGHHLPCQHQPPLITTHHHELYRWEIIPQYSLP